MNDELSRLNIELVSFRDQIETGGPPGRATAHRVVHGQAPLSTRRSKLHDRKHDLLPCIHAVSKGSETSLPKPRNINSRISQIGASQTYIGIVETRLHRDRSVLLLISLRVQTATAWSISQHWPWYFQLSTGMPFQALRCRAKHLRGLTPGRGFSTFLIAPP